MKGLLGERINWGVALLVIVIGFVITLAIMLRYKSEGEKDLPIKLNKILVISSAEAEDKEEGNSIKWDLNINQYNDVYLNFEKNSAYGDIDYIESISLENIKITKKPKTGQLYLYMPSSTEGKDYQYDELFLIGNSLTYNGATSDNPKTLQIARTGGTLSFRILNKNVGQYTSDADEEISYDGTLLQKAGINLQDINAEINFDIVIKTNKTAYRGNLSIEVPSEKVQEDGVAMNDPEEFVDIVFKRERK